MKFEKLMIILILAILVILIVLIALNINKGNNYDEYYKSDPYYVIDAAGLERQEYADELKTTEINDSWARADSLLILARMGMADYKDACELYKKFIPRNDEQKALLYETLASLNCDSKRKDYLIQAAVAWESLGVSWRAEILRTLEEDKLSVTFETSEIESSANFQGKDKIIIGNSSILIEKNSIIVAQTDRVFRDWLGNQLANPFNSEILKTFSERKTYPQSELREDIGWHEGGRLLDIKNHIPVNHKTAVGTMITKLEGKWYAPDENGIFSFEVPEDKVAYPTTRFLSNDIAVIIDTHGVNMIVEQAVRNNANTVIACCDHSGKIKAALYLAKRGINVIYFTDLYLYEALGNKANILGSPPITYSDDTIVLGNRPIEIKKNEKIVVSKALLGKYAVWYYSAPSLYFGEIARSFPLILIEVGIGNFSESYKIYDKARENNAKIVATRVFSKSDYEYAKQWLLESEENKIILFHSTAYPYGLLLTKEFPEQTSFNNADVTGI